MPSRKTVSQSLHNKVASCTKGKNPDRRVIDGNNMANKYKCFYSNSLVTKAQIVLFTNHLEILL